MNRKKLGSGERKSRSSETILNTKLYQKDLNDQISIQNTEIDKLESTLNDLVKVWKEDKRKELHKASTIISATESEIIEIQEDAEILGLTLDLSKLNKTSTSRDFRKHLNFCTLESAEWLIINGKEIEGLPFETVLAMWVKVLGKPLGSHESSFKNFWKKSLSSRKADMKKFKSKEL